MKKGINYFSGILIGLTNVIVGACGGIVAVESLKRNKLDQTQSHATAISIMLPLTAISAILYIYKGNVTVKQSLIYLIPGIAGAFAGAALLPRIPKKALTKIFAIFIIYAGIRMYLK